MENQTAVPGDVDRSPTKRFSSNDVQMELDTSKIDFDCTAFIWSKSALGVAAEIGVDIDTTIERLRGIENSNFITYPDGSIQYEGKEALDTFESAAGNRVRKHAVQSSKLTLRRSSLMPLSGSWYKGLEPFAKDRRYALWLWSAFALKNDGSHLVIDTGSDWLVNAYPQCPIDNLLVTFVLHRRFSKRTRTEFAALLTRWISKTQGVGDSPALIDQHATFFDRVAQIRVNACNSTQEAFNWLILSLIDYCATNRVLKVCFTENADAYTSIHDQYELTSQNPTLLRIDV